MSPVVICYGARNVKALRPDQKSVTTADGTEIAYRVLGHGDPVLLAGGLGAGWEIWKHQIEYLADRYRFISWDYRGLFGSGLPLNSGSLGVSDHAADGLRVLDAEGGKRAAFVGWSMGAHVSLEMFARDPSRCAALVLVSGAPPTEGTPGLGGGMFARALPWFVRGTASAPTLVEAIVRAGLDSPEAFTWARRLGLVSRNVGQRQFADLVAGLSGLDWLAYSAVLDQLRHYDATPILSDVDVPTLAIVGGRDPFTPVGAVQAMVSRIRGAEHLVVPGGTHFVLADFPEHVSLRIEKFFRERGFGAHA